MKDLSDYLNSTSDIVEKAGAFYAFSNEQLEKQAKEGVQYIALGSGLICPKDNAKQLQSDMFDKLNKAVQQDIKENGIDSIIRRELYNHEAIYTNDIDSTVDALEIYNIDIEDIYRIYYEEIRKQDE
ncbi:hypothetical protein HX049_18220 [Myroides odoratimimus]|uniref:DUF7659 family protein n=1 Tax=Myroides odoratimimus TaxID=76832 RepID=UPI002578F1B6|nr:hypothetical protein [Myroides odoratimimus]MDM1399062.1 hypothetical protein [Myroides odoratimimus]